jgi:hypothetical protein
MKRYRTISHGDDEFFEAPSIQRRKQPGSRDEEDSRNESELDTTQNPNDARLCLLSLVCDQRLSNKKSKNSHGQGGAQETEIAQMVSGEKESSNTETEVSVLKSAEDLPGITSPVIISTSDDENADLSDVSSDPEMQKYVDKAQSNHTTTKSKPTAGSMEKEEKEESSSLWMEVCRPVPLPPRLPMVPAGYVFPLYKAPNMM